MSQYQHKENRGNLFVNDPKRTPLDPDLSGSANIAGTLYQLSATKNDRGNLDVRGPGVEGLLYDNRSRKQQPKSPDVSGPVTVNGKKYRIAGWDGFTMKGLRKLSLQIGEFTEKATETIPALVNELPTAADVKAKTKRR